ncbi:MAG: NAD-dependent epimerase/dehydratase family protein [Rhodospirillaceae bacterium]|nr:NAD-dependent epimerase/dehydratase family protein [Rhodospirillaceae bacterium]MBT6426837.1 NAD-dependent epimerase/dehydratase family protein [Rhodospirillaceae bacterium]MBT7760450.1 NAD-dependent epimerase/dehydratase family protein [Rhodospirillaceae bacterium]
MKALVIGGTGPTGPYLVNGLIAQGYDVSIMHRGTHDSDEIPASVERIIGDPHFRETIREALDGRSFDLIIATYGRIRYIAELAGDYADRLITVGGAPCFRGVLQPEALTPAGLQVPLPEDAPKVESEEEFRFGYLVRLAEEAVMAGHAEGRYSATHFRYPVVYGPRQLTPTIWTIMRRFMDKRPYMVLPDGGLTLTTRGYSENVAHAVLLAARQPEAAAGQIYDCGDEHQLTMAQWIEVVGHAMDGEIEIISVPDQYAYPARGLMMFHGPSNHQLFDLYKVKSELGYRDIVPPLEAMARTVHWYRDNPPVVTDQFAADLAESYGLEDAIAAVYRDACEKLSAIAYEKPDFHHPYPHPKKPGLQKDHRAR